MRHGLKSTRPHPKSQLFALLVILSVASPIATMPPRYTVVPLKPAADENAPRAPSPHHHRSRRSSIAAPASLLSQRPRRMSLADRKAMNIAELLASSSPLPPPPRMRDVDALVKTPGKGWLHRVDHDCS